MSRSRLKEEVIAAIVAAAAAGLLTACERFVDSRCVLPVLVCVYIDIAFNCVVIALLNFS